MTTKIQMTALIIALLTSTGCTMDAGGVVDKNLNKILICKDTRDNSTFSFNTSTITNIRVGVGAASSFDVVTTDGIKKSLNSDMERYLKCEQSK